MSLLLLLLFNCLLDCSVVVVAIVTYAAVSGGAGADTVCVSVCLFVFLLKNI